MFRKRGFAAIAFLGAGMLAGALWLPPAGGDAGATPPSPQASQAAAPAAQLVAQNLERKRIEQIVREYLIQNPEVLVEAMQALEAKRNAQRAAEAQVSIRRNKARIYADPEDPVGGNPRGDVTIVEFFDYRCGFCKRVAPTVEEALAKDGKIRLVYKEFPVLGPPSVLAARAALASKAQGKYLAFHKALMEARISFDEASIIKLAARVGIDTSRLQKDMRSPRVQAAIDKNRALARTLGIRGTPAFIVGEKLFPGAVSAEQLERMIREARGG